MPKKLSKEVGRDIVRHRLKGYGRDETASKIGVSTGKVSNATFEFEQLAKTNNIRSAAKTYNVEIEVEQLLKLAALSKKHGITISQAIAGAKIMEKLTNLGIDEDDFEKFSTKIYQASRKSRHTPEELIEYASKLGELEKETGLDYNELLKKYQGTSKEKNKLEQEVRALQKQQKKALTEKKVTIQALNEYIATREALKKYGIEVANFNKIRTLLKNAEETGYDVKTILESISRIEYLDSRKSILEGEVSQLEGRKNSLERDIAKAESSLKGKKLLLNELGNLKKMGLDVARLASLRQTLIEVMSQHGFKSEEAIEKFFQDLKDYNRKLGFELEIKRLETTKGTLEDESKRWQVKVDALREKHIDLNKNINTIKELVKKGVKPENIEKWDKVISKCGKSPDELYSELEKYAGITKLIDFKQSNLKTMEEDLNKRRTELEELTKQKSLIEASIKAIATAGVEEVKKAGENVVSEVEKSTSETRSKNEETLKKAEETINNFESRTDTLLQKCLDTGKMLGRYEAVEPLFNFITSGEGARHKVLPTILEVNEKFKTWLRKHPPKDSILIVKLDGLIEVMAEEMGFGELHE